MAVTNQNFTIFQRSDYALEFTVTDENGDPEDCTGSSFEFVLVDAYTAVEALRISDDNRFSISGNNNSSVTVTLSEEESDVSASDYRYELRMSDVFGNTAPVATGMVTVEFSNTNIF